MRYLFLLILLMPLGLFAQYPPDSVNFQFVARDSSGEVLANKTIDVEVYYYDNPSTFHPMDKYRVNKIKTNQFGLFNVYLKTNCWDKVKFYEPYIIYQGKKTCMGIQGFYSTMSCCGLYGCSETCIAERYYIDAIAKTRDCY